jgi:hypothetical protein
MAKEPIHVGDVLGLAGLDADDDLPTVLIAKMNNFEGPLLRRQANHRGPFLGP